MNGLESFIDLLKNLISPLSKISPRTLFFQTNSWAFSENFLVLHSLQSMVDIDKVYAKFFLQKPLNGI